MQKNRYVTDENKERIKFNVEIIKIAVLFFMASAGGAISIILQGVPMARHVVISVAGMIVAVATGIFAWKTYRETDKLLDD